MPNVVHSVYDTDSEATWNFVNWYVHGVYDGETDLALIMFSKEVWFFSQ
jgi:hypothetical protein